MSRNLLLWLTIALCTGFSATIKVTDQGYENIIVAIHPSIPEKDEFLSNLQALLRKTSSFLHRVTRERLYIRSVTIVIPASWSRKDEYQKVSGDMFQMAHLQIVKNSSGIFPMVEQPYGCGEPGISFKIPSGFIEDLKQAELPEYYMVHEWAHYRYGVFDEFGNCGSKEYPQVYVVKGELKPNACTGTVDSAFQTIDGDICVPTEGKLDLDSCVCFEPITPAIIDTMRASVMFLPAIDTVQDFCDDDGVLDRKHNVAAPNKQNAMCNHQSTWKIILNHTDFQSADVKIPLGKTHFHFVQPENPSGRYVLVLDVSASMMIDGRIHSLHAAASQLLNESVLTGSEVSIVTFSNHSSVVSHLTILSDATREKIAGSLPTSVDEFGWTAIGKGLQAAIQELSRNGSNPAGGVILLITDGSENIRPFINELLPELQRSQVVVNTLAVGNIISDDFENVATFTGGKSFAVRTLNSSKDRQDLSSKFFFAVLSTKREDLRPVTILKRDITLSPGGHNSTFSAYIDSESDKQVTFLARGDNMSDVSLAVVSPAGHLYSTTYDRRSNGKSVTVYKAQPGVWKVISSSSTKESSLRLTITSSSAEKSRPPVRTSTHFSRLRLEDQNSELRMCVSVKKGESAILDAVVFFLVHRPSGDAVNITARDNGKEADVTKDDGLYCSFFTDFTGKGRYSVETYVKNSNRSRLVLRSNYPQYPLNPSSKNRKRVKRYSQEYSEEENTLEPFQRFEDAGSFKLDKFDPNHHYPPADIRDLSVEDVLYENETKWVQLSWTAPGGQMSTGRCTEYELRGSTDIRDLFDDFDHSFHFTLKDVVSGSLLPLNRGKKQRVTLSMPTSLFVSNDTDASYDVYFALKSWNSYGRQSGLSNIATANFILLRLLPPAAIQGNKTKIILLGSVGAVIIFLLIFVGLWFAVCKRKRDYDQKMTYRACPQQI